jgi:hypothetical protein
MLVWLLDLSIGGRSLFLSSSPVHFDGRFYSGTLDNIDFTEALDGIGDSASDRSATVNAIVDGGLGLLLSQGHDFTTGKATLRLWATDEPEHRAATVLFEAFVSQPEVGDEFEPVSFSISQRILDDKSQLLKPEARISQDSVQGVIDASGASPWVSDAGSGAFYPMIFGRPSGDVSRRSAGSPAFGQAVVNELGQLEPSEFGRVDGLTANTGRIIVSGHNPGTSSNVALYYEEGGGLERFNAFGNARDPKTDEVTDRNAIPDNYPLYAVRDSVGNTVWVADVFTMPATSTERQEATDREYWVKWPEDTKGIRNAAMGGHCDTPGRLIAHLAQLSSLPYDVPSIISQVMTLPGKVGFYVDEQISPSELMSEVIEKLPLSAYNGPNGITFIRVDKDLPVERCVPLVEGLNCWRVGPLTLTRREDEAVGEIVVQYGPTAGTDGYQGSVTVSQRPNSPKKSTPWALMSPRSDAVQEEELRWTYDEATAIFVAKWLARKNSYSPKVVDLQLDYSIARNLTPGSGVAFTDPSIGLDESVGIVSERTMSDNKLWTIKVAFYPSTSSQGKETPAGASSVGTPVASTQ